jgi:hypothetical protein
MLMNPKMALITGCSAFSHDPFIVREYELSQRREI